MDGTSSRSRWSPEGWRLWTSLAVASLLAAWVPIVISLAVPMYAFDYWGVGSGYLGFGWLAAAVLTGLAVSRFARERGTTRPRRYGAVAGVVTGATLLVGLSVWGASIESRWKDESAELAWEPTETAEPTAVTPESLVHVQASASGRVLDAVCEPISEGSAFCAVTFEGRLASSGR